MSKPEEEQKNSSTNKLSVLGIIFCAIITVWLISILAIYLLFDGLNNRALFGDSFGAINALFSGLAFGGIIYTILLQRKELQLQRQELILTREELSRTADAQENSNKFQFEQLRIYNIPLFQFRTFREFHENFLIISNESSNASFDIDIWVFISIFEDDHSKKEFVESFVKEKMRPNIDVNKFIDEGVWALSDRGVYSAFPPNSKIRIPLIYPVEIFTFDIFIQFRDALENNYSQVINFIPSEDESTPFKICVTDPKVLKVYERFEIHDKIDIEQIPSPFQRVYKLHKASVYSAQIIGSEFAEVESQWDMTKL